MKKILVPTDFSPTANNAAQYALHLAAPLKADIILCNAMLIPIEATGSDQVAWALQDYDAVKTDTTEQLQQGVRKLKHRLKEHVAFFPDDFKPEITFTSEVGLVSDVIRNALDKHGASLVVMGVSGAGSLERFFMGSNSWDVISKAAFPVLLIPPEYIFRPLKKIAFATDLDKRDINILHTMACFAKTMDAEIQINHISDDNYEQGEDRYKADVFMAELCKKISYPNIRYRHIKSTDVDHGLNWLHEHGQVDMLVMVHRQLHFLARLFSGSHTQKLARHVTIPLLVFPPEYGAAI